MLSLYSSVPILFECMDGDQWIKSEVWSAGALAKDAECRQFIEGLTNCVAVREDGSSSYALAGTGTSWTSSPSSVILYMTD